MKLLVLAASPFLASAALQCNLLKSGSYTCSRFGGAVVAVGAPISVFVDGSWHSNGDGSLKFVSSVPLNGRTAAFGDYHGMEVRWLAGKAPFVTRVQNYEAAPGLADGAVVFSYDLPDGANVAGNSHTLHTDFPAFVTLSNASSALSWSGDFVGASGGVTTGIEGGPVLFSDVPSPTSPMLLVSPLSHFLTSSSATTAHDGRGLHWAGGLSASIKAVPANFTHSFILAAGLGATDTLYNWGQLVMHHQAGLAGTTAIAKVFDQTLAHLSYQTDNGGQYCFCNQGCDHKLLQMRDYLKELGVPIRLVSFQGGWWSNPKIHTPDCAPWCVTSWTPNKTKVPMGLPAFHAALELPLQLYAPVRTQWHVNSAPHPPLSFCFLLFVHLVPALRSPLPHTLLACAPVMHRSTSAMTPHTTKPTVATGHSCLGHAAGASRFPRRTIHWRSTLGSLPAEWRMEWSHLNPTL